MSDENQTEDTMPTSETFEITMEMVVAHAEWRRSRWSSVRLGARLVAPAGARVVLAAGLAWGALNLTGADLTGADLRGADLTDAVLTDADLGGADLTDADLGGADLTDADLTDAVLTDAVLTGAVLRGAVLGGADLTDADLRGADLTDAVLTDAVLTDAVLRGADLTDADLGGAVLTDAVLTGAVPTVPHIDAAILAAVEGPAPRGALNMSDWHRGGPCGTTHCRAGWAIHLAGAEGAALEQRFGSGPAGALIYARSRPGMPVPDFYCDTEEALADIRRCAAADPLPEGER